MPLKQLLGDGSQTTAHAGYVKRILEMLELFKLPVWGNNRCRVSRRAFFAWIPGGRVFYERAISFS